MNSTNAANFGGINVRPPIAAGGQRIGLLGGTFDPAHKGHQHISEFALKSCALDQVWWLVTPGNPIKSINNLTKMSDRISAAQEIAGHPRIKVTGFEAALGTSYTAETLKFLSKRYSSTNFIWLMGADNLINFHMWQKWKSIFQIMPIAVFDRPEYRLKALASPAAQRFASRRRQNIGAASLITSKPPVWAFLTLPLTSISSTKLRQK